MAYVYRHIRHDKNEPFYIGISTTHNYKRAKESKKRNDIWHKITQKTSWDWEILFDGLSLSDAKKKEIEFINLYGRIDNNDGILANLSGGGDGLFNVSNSVKDKLSNYMKNGKAKYMVSLLSEESKANRLERLKLLPRKPMSQQTKDKISKANKGKVGWNKGKKDEKGGRSRSGMNHASYKGGVSCLDKNGNTIQEFNCIGDAAKYFKTNTNNIRRVIVGERSNYRGNIFIYNGKLL